MTWDSLGPTMMEPPRPAAVLNEIFAIVPFSSSSPMTWDSLGPLTMELLKHAAALNKILMQCKIVKL